MIDFGLANPEVNAHFEKALAVDTDVPEPDPVPIDRGPGRRVKRPGLLDVELHGFP